MNIGAFFDKIIMVAIGVFFIYLSKTKKEKLGDKAKFLKYGGIAIIVIYTLLGLMVFLTKK